MDAEVVQRDAAALLPLTPAVFFIALALAGRARHGYAIMQQVETLSEGSMTLGPGTLYRSLQRMQVDTLIEELVDRSQGADDARRRYYRLTAFGKEVARSEAARLQKLVVLAGKQGLLGAQRGSRLQRGARHAR